MLDLKTILASKTAYRTRLAALPIAEKLRLLDALRERTLILREAATAGERSRAASTRPSTNVDDTP